MTEDDAEQIPALDNVLDMELDADEDRRYLVLYDEDYDDILLDAEDSVALLLDCNQACEVLRLANEIVSALAPAKAPDKEPLEALIDELQEVASSTTDSEQTLRELHQRFTTLESAVESAVNDLRANSRPGQKKREIANNLEAALEGDGRYVDSDTEGSDR